MALLLSPTLFQTVSAATAPSLGTAASFAVLGGSAVTNTGPTVVNGDVGVSPGSAITGFPPGIVVAPGTTHAGDAVAAQAQNDVTTAFNAIAVQACNTDLTGMDLGGLTLLPGFYCFSTSAQLTGALTLDAQGNPNAVFIFRIGSTLTTASNSSVSIINGGLPCNVFWQIGSSATLGTNTAFQGNILASASITLNTNTSVSGRALAQTGAVTMDSTVISVPNCSGVPANGLVQVCKVAGSGVATGTNFSFNVAGTLVTVAAGSAPGGTCGTPVTVPTGSAVVTETLPGGTVLAGVSTLPSAGLLVSSNLGAGTATVTVVAGGQTNLVFVDAATPLPNTGYVQVCKVAGSGVTVGTNFTFDVAGNPVTVAAGPAPGGTCGTPVALPSGSAVITESLLAGTTLAGVSTLPSAGLLVGSNLAAGTATVTVVAGGQTTVTFIDVATPLANTGYVQVCKVAGSGVTVGTNFSFNVAGNPVVVAAGLAPGGTCATPVSVAAGSAVITETVPAGTTLTAVSTLPSAGLLVSSNLGAGTATVTVAAGGQTIVTFVDSAPAAIAAPALTKAFFPSAFNSSPDTTTLVFTITNPNPTISLTGVNFTDTLPSGLAQLAGGVSKSATCGAGAIISVAGTNLITVTGVTLAPGATCILTVTTISGVAVGIYTNTTSLVGSVEGGTGPAASANILVQGPIGGPPGSYQLFYAANLQSSDSYIDITNSGANGAGLFYGTGANITGAICVNTYAFASDEQLVACCSCPVTPNGLTTLSVKNDLLNNVVSQQSIPTSISISMTATLPVAGSCIGSSYAPITAQTLAPGMVAWGVTQHSNTSSTPFTDSITGSAFSPGVLSFNEAIRLQQLCMFINSNNSGYGVCNSCKVGGQEAGKK